MIQKFCSS